MSRVRNWSIGTGEMVRRPLRLLAMMLVAVCAAAISVVAAQAPAQAVPGQNYLRNWSTGRCLDANDRGQMYTLPCSMPVGSNRYQLWRPIDQGSWDGHDLVMLQHVKTGYCVQVNTGGGAGLSECNSAKSTQWEVVGGRDWYKVALKNRFSDLCLDGNSQGAVYGYGCIAGNGYQQWRLGY
ncbi:MULTISPECIES: ricin-type beta-trefoil lectin domain protein [unclassified Solwaraspora]|uniref:RICIN domain-containing protein n=1 Tax=unclassified Solwaraspora TaxID=2627926 RepID=UPI00249B42EA|nr:MULTISPECIES: ricin-type beta-trefoil lectin domain protein [unclassified Solwaraspora]WFE23942.1 ricin-type beta-trefoil lectin domain protein [Solwaraspora sp. WMMD937]WJK34498.1 ricin-type beta-trefoil lectin domain protein [Solwaraspora sp. WMMA2065]